MYCQVQQIEEEEVKIQLTSLWLEGTTLVWWERKLQKGGKQVGNLLSSWSDCIFYLCNQFYPLGYVKISMMDWKRFRQSKGHIFHNCTEEFRKKTLDLNVY